MSCLFCPIIAPFLIFSYYIKGRILGFIPACQEILNEICYCCFLFYYLWNTKGNKSGNVSTKRKRLSNGFTCSEVLVRYGKYSLQITRHQQMTVIGKENFCKLQTPFLLLCMAIYYYTRICLSVRCHYIVIAEKTNNICDYLVASSASGIMQIRSMMSHCETLVMLPRAKTDSHILVWKEFFPWYVV